MPGTISNLQIFGAGTWDASTGRVTITEQHLDEIVDAFAALGGSSVVKPHLKLGHGDAQKWFGQKTGVPTLGWISKVWREGSKLLADITDVPEALLSLIKSSRYHNVSAEVFPPGKIKLGDRTFGHVLSAIALLGIEMPAVTDLAGLAAALFQEHSADPEVSPMLFSQPLEQAVFTQEQVDSLIAAATTKAVDEAVGKFNSQVTDLSAQITVLTKRAEAAEGGLIKAQEDVAQAEAIRVVDDAIKVGKLLPKQRDFALAFMTGVAGPVKFGAGETSPAKLFQDFLEASSAQVDTKERGHARESTGAYATAAQELDARTKELSAKDKVSYSDAMASVLSLDPDLKSRYSAAA